MQDASDSFSWKNCTIQMFVRFAQSCVGQAAVDGECKISIRWAVREPLENHKLLTRHPVTNRQIKVLIFLILSFPISDNCALHNCWIENESAIKNYCLF